MYNIICPIKVNKKNFDLFWPASQKFFRHIKKSKEFDTEENIRRSFSEFMINSIDTKLNAFHITIWYSKIYLIANSAAISAEIREVDKKIVKYKSCATHYLMGIGPITKKIPQNSGKQIWIPEVM